MLAVLIVASPCSFLLAPAHLGKAPWADSVTVRGECHGRNARWDIPAVWVAKATQQRAAAMRASSFLVGF